MSGLFLYLYFYYCWIPNRKTIAPINITTKIMTNSINIILPIVYLA